MSVALNLSLSFSLLLSFPLSLPPSQLLAQALLRCHEEAALAGQKLALEVFVSGRNRLENEGAAALSEVFEVLAPPPSIT